MEYGVHPTRYGWGSSIFGIASIPVLSAASVGHMVASAVVSQIKPETFERVTGFTSRDDKDEGKR